MTTTGSHASRYFIRLSKTGDPNAAISYNVGNGGPTLDQREVIDAGFLELARLGELPVGDTDIARSLQVVDATIRSTTVRGPGWHRYNGDGYGDRASDGRPWAPSGQGTGHLWPALSAERGEHEQATGNATGAASLLLGMSRFASGVGLIPEQNWELPDLPPSPFGTDPTLASIGFENGGRGRLGLAAHLVGRLVRAARGQPRCGPQRRPAGGDPLALRRPNTGPDVADRDEPGGQLLRQRLAGDRDGDDCTREHRLRLGDEHRRRARRPRSRPRPRPRARSASTSRSPAGRTSSTSSPSARAAATAQVKRTVLFDFVPGTLLLDVTDPNGDDNGPGNYAYPTSPNFQPGAFDIQRFQVYDSGADVTFRLQTRNLTETFGSPLGAQLVDVYVRVPGASTTFDRRRASAAQLHHRPDLRVEPRSIQVQGFGQRYVDASGATLGTATISGNPISRFITFSVPKASLGTPSVGLGLHGRAHRAGRLQPGPGARLRPQPQDFQFGVCAAASADPHCTSARPSCRRRST